MTTTGLPTRSLEWKVRLKLADGTVYVGGYMGNGGQCMYLADELSGEVKDFPYDLIHDFDVRKYSG